MSVQYHSRQPDDKAFTHQKKQVLIEDSSIWVRTIRNWSVDVALKTPPNGPGGVRFDSWADRIGYSVVQALSRGEELATRNSLRRNTASVMKI